MGDSIFKIHTEWCNSDLRGGPTSLKFKGFEPEGYENAMTID